MRPNARRASRQGAAAFAVAPTLLRDRFNYSAASSASLSRHRISISALLQRDLCRTLRLPQFLDARFEPCDVFACPREGKLTKLKGLRQAIDLILEHTHALVLPFPPVHNPHP